MLAASGRSLDLSYAWSSSEHPDYRSTHAVVRYDSRTVRDQKYNAHPVFCARAL